MERLANRSSQRPAAANRRFKFNKRRQLFIRTHNEALTVAVSATKIVRPLELIAETQPQLQPDALRLSATISQYCSL